MASQCSQRLSGRMLTPSSYTLMLLAPSDLVLTWMVPGSEVTASHTSYPSAPWTAHQVSLRQPSHPVFKAPWHNGSPKNPVLYCSQKQLYDFPGAPSRQTELHCGHAVPQSNITLLFPCPPGQPAAHACTSGPRDCLSPLGCWSNR